MSETWIAIVMVILGASLTLNVFLGIIAYRVIREEIRWRDRHHRFIHGQSVYVSEGELTPCNE